MKPLTPEQVETILKDLEETVKWLERRVAK